MSQSSFNIHKQTDSKEDQQKLERIIIGQTMRATRHDFKIWCGCCMKDISIVMAYRCLYCGIWFCRKCGKIHFGDNKKDGE